MSLTGDSATFRFVGLELPWALGPADGRYVLRGHAGEPAHVLRLETIRAPARRRRRGLRRRGARDAAPLTVPTTRVTLIDAVAADSAAAGRAWLAHADLTAQARQAVAVLNGVLHAERLVRGDPFVREVALEQALQVVVGVGRGEALASGRWPDARPLDVVPAERAAARRRRRDRLAALLAGRDVTLACEELTLRARLDLDRGRLREAALQLRVALDAALAELPAWSHHADVAAQIARLEAARPAVAAAAAQALQGGLDPAASADVARVVDLLERALAARVAHGVE